ncbi:MAG TPA: 23S rRNA (adenine(2030)-N(6))-methyltransferase RlmJ [Xanthobacteraceae bacterium]|jgi:23S rRNA (adenine2030-N6)-methyltransferase|nr:23S rRNA (adenine(2030)-N(6))-methyltransferase RlmJ [Xanthobacteraceae bacterium]
MNYRHAFHAGNFADVVKHAVLTRLLLYLCGKPAPFRVIDTHAGAGVYDLGSPEAQRSGEWQNGIGRLMDAGREIELDPIPSLLAPYLQAVAACNAKGKLTTYPGSPALVRAFLRAQDRLIACELEPQAAAALKHHVGHDHRIKVIAIDGWTALNAYVPPKERRGLVLIDPPFEASDDFVRLTRGLETAHRKWANGMYMLWYPIKGRAEPDALARRLSGSGIGKVLRAELDIGKMSDPARLSGCGLVIVNPPWTLQQELDTLLPALAARLSPGGGGKSRIDRISE